jgi:methylenetetrahydrofolate reductase (NADPH)
MMRDHGCLLSGRPLSSAPRWFIGAVENPFAAPQRFRADRLGKKVAAGAQFVQTQFVFDVPAFARWMERVRALGLHERCFILAGVGPVRSLRALEHMRREVPGLHVPEEIARRIHATPEDRVSEEGIALCAEIIQQVRAIPGVAGVHVMAFGWEEAVPEILARAGLGRRPAIQPVSETARGTADGPHGRYGEERAGAVPDRPATALPDMAGDPGRSMAVRQPVRRTFLRMVTAAVAARRQTYAPGGRG